MNIEIFGYMSGANMFLWGFVGSLAIEIVRVNSCIQRSPKKLPLRYHLWKFYFVRLLLAFVGGVVALAYQIQSPLLALHIGAATPLIVGTFSRNLDNL